MDPKLAVLVTLSLMAACVGPAEGEPDAGAPQATGGTALVADPSFNLTECRGSLSIWLVPLERLARDLPREFPPQPYRLGGASTGLGRVLFHVFGCRAASGAPLDSAQSLAMLSIRVDPPAPVSPRGPSWQPAYLLSAWYATPSMAQLLAEYPFWVRGEDRSTYTNVAAAPRIHVEWAANASVVLRINQEPVPPAESFNPSMRFYRIAGDRLRIHDFSLTTTLWEGAGRPAYDANSPLAPYIQASVGPPDLHGLPSVQLATRFHSTPWPPAD